MKTVITGVISKIDDEQVKPNYRLRNIEITVKNFDRETGAAISEEVFPMSVFNKKIDELKPLLKIDARVKVTAYLKSLKNEKDGKTFYNIAVNVSDMSDASFRQVESTI
ncbi:MAG: hypothetical protein V4547_16220 [Bacteroidota bacterium]